MYSLKLFHQGLRPSRNAFLRRLANGVKALYTIGLGTSPGIWRRAIYELVNGIKKCRTKKGFLISSTPSL